MTLHRTFVSIELSPENRRLAADLQERLRASGARLRWVRPANLHFTLRFLGELPTAQVGRVAVATREAVKTVAPFMVTIGDLGAFPSFERPQVVWVASKQGAEALERLAASLNAALARERFPADPRHFRPHLTLGRSKDDRQWGDLVRALEQHRHTVLGSQLVEVVTIMESRLTPDAPIYTPWEQVHLGHGLNSSGA